MGVEIIQDIPIVVRVTGEIDISNVSELSDALDKAARESPQGFVVDMSRLDYTDASGVRAVLEAHAQVCRTGGSVALVAHGVTRTLIRTLGLDGLPGLLLCDDLRVARKALSTRGRAE